MLQIFGALSGSLTVHFMCDEAKYTVLLFLSGKIVIFDIRSKIV